MEDTPIFQLFLYQHKSNKITEEDIRQFLRKIPEIDAETGLYTNITGVMFCIEQSSGYYPEIHERYNDFKFTNFSFQMELMRPFYFAYEAFPILDRLINDLDLYILDEQQDSELQKFSLIEMIESYLHDNNQQTILHYDKEYRYYVPLDQTMYCWHYYRYRKRLKSMLPRYNFCDYEFIINKASKETFTGAIWNKKFPCLIPKVDYIIKGYSESNTVVVPYITFMEYYWEHYRPFNQIMPDLITIQRPASLKNNLPWQPLQEIGEIITIDEIVNIKPSFLSRL